MRSIPGVAPRQHERLVRSDNYEAILQDAPSGRAATVRLGRYSVLTMYCIAFTAAPTIRTVGAPAELQSLAMTEH